MILIKGGHVHGVSAKTADVMIEDGKIVEISENIPITDDATVLNASGLIVAPGLVDMHVHFREPGFEYKEDIMTGASAAAAGGVTTCCCMPNTSPVADNVDTINYIVNKAKHAPVTVLPYGAVTDGQEGRELTDFVALKVVGAIALSDDGNTIQSAAIKLRALRLANDYGMLVISHCEDADMVKDYAVNEGAVSRELGMPGRPAIAESLMVARDALLTAETGSRVHIAHVSTALSVELIRKAKKAGVNITAETCPHYFSLTEEEVLRQGTLARVNPPLRTTDDVAAIIRGLADGTIDAIATDHAPHSAEEKSLPLAEAPSGIIGLETSLAVALTFLYHRGDLSINKIIALMSANPAKILGIEGGALIVGATADIVIFDPNEAWTVDVDHFRSKARNTPFGGMKLRGKVKYTISRGEIAYKDGERREEKSERRDEKSERRERIGERRKERGKRRED